MGAAMKVWTILTGAMIVCVTTCVSAQETPYQDTRTQYPAALANSYFTFNVGSIRYLFTGQQLGPGFRAESVDVPHLGVRVDLFGHRFLKHLAAQVTYMRPARFVAYGNVNGDETTHQILQAYGGVTLVLDTSFSARLSGYVEGG